MKTKWVAITLMVLLIGRYASAQNESGGYDSTLAKKLSADKYGMKSYVLVLLKTGAANITDKKVRDSLFGGHIRNIQRLAAEGKLIVSGPIGKNGKNYEGLFVFNTKSIYEARAMLETDPAIQAKLLDADLFPWYSSAALQQIPAQHNKLSKTSL